MKPVENTKIDTDEWITLVSNDKQEFKVLLAAVKAAPGSVSKNNTISNLIVDVGTDSPIQLPDVDGKTLGKVVEYLMYHLEHPLEPVKEEDLQRADNICEWDKKFCEIEHQFLDDLILAANFLELHDLLHLGCKPIANMLKGKTPDEIKKTFNILKPLSPEEEEKVRKENSWLEETA